MTNRWPIIAFVGVLLVSLVFTGYLVRSVSEDLKALSTSKNDDVSWRLSQLEVEILNLQIAAQAAQDNSAGDLSSFLRRYDIFYSRVDTLSHSALQDMFVDHAEAQGALNALLEFLETTTPIIDGPRGELRAALPDLKASISDMRPQARTLALAGIQIFAMEDSQRRAALSLTLKKLAISSLGLVLLVTIAFLVVGHLYQGGKKVSAENQRVRSRFEAAIGSALDAVLVVDTSGRIIEFNGGAEDVFGYSKEEALGQDMAEMIVPEHMRAMHNTGMNRYLETGEKKVIDAGRVRLEAMRKSGEVFPVELSISLAEAEGERVFVSYLRDITTELKTVDDLRAARDKAREGEKAKSDLLTVMSHEMRTPLNGILGSLSLIDQTHMRDRQKQHLKSIAASGELLLSHVNDVLDLSRLSSDAPSKERARFDLNDVLQNVSDSLMANAEKRGNSMSFDVLSKDLNFVSGYKTPLQQCLINLVGNAIKFTTDGVISVEVERLPDDDMVEIRVSDTGVGIAPENMERIFEEFVTIDTAFDRENAGTGLGLAITKRLVENMGGTLEVDSILDEGSLFSVKIPLPDAPWEKKDAEPKQTDTHVSLPAGLRALVVDDNEINRMVLMDMLQQLGLNPVEAEDGYAAIDLVAAHEYEAIFLDISMPGIDGIETLQRIRNLDVPWHDVPAIAVTAHAAQKDHEKIMQAPFADLIVKPIQVDTVKSVLGQVMSLDPQAPQVPSEETPQTDFEARFGHERYSAACKGLDQDLEHLVKLLHAAPGLTPEIREFAHKTAGTAAILEETTLWEALIALENASEDAGQAASESLQSLVAQRTGLTEAERA